MKKFSLNRTTKKGFSLLEVILVLAVIAGAAVAVFMAYESAKPSSDAANEDANLTTLTTNLKATLGISGNYTGLANATGVQLKVFPSDMVSGATVAGAWGTVAISAEAGTDPGVSSPCTVANRCFMVTYSNVPQAACAKFVTGVASYFNAVNIGTTNVAAKGKVLAAMPAQCASADPVASISFIGN